MKRNPDVGAACGRIHPTGSGYMQWWVISKNYLNEEKNNVHHWIGQVSKVWVCHRTLAPEGDWAHAWLCSLQVDNHSWRLQLNLILSPGCFSLFRAKAVMDENVMHTYTTVASQPKHFVQYDQVSDFKRQQQAYFSLSQGEDRWLCTLLLKQGWRVEYSAASDSFTACPEVNILI